MERSSPEYIYLMQESEFVQSSQPVYRLGRTKQPDQPRFRNYPQGNDMLIIIMCPDSVGIERVLLDMYKTKYVQRRDIGNKYFEGNYQQMIADICSAVRDSNK